MSRSFRPKLFASTALLAVIGLVSPTSAAVVEINEFESGLGSTADVWYAYTLNGSATASIVDLTTAGGNLENNQPLPTGAAQLTVGTFSDNAQVGVRVNSADATAALTTGTYAYDYFRAGGNAPELRISILSPNFSGDNSGALTYKPSLNGDFTQNQWQSVSTSSTSGLWTWNGGLGIGNGNTSQTLAQWAADFAASDSNFDSAYVLVAGVGIVGTQNMVGYFDNVTFSIPSVFDETTYDFEVVPEPASLGLLVAGGVLLLPRRRRG